MESVVVGKEINCLGITLDFELNWLARVKSIKGRFLIGVGNFTGLLVWNLIIGYLFSNTGVKLLLREFSFMCWFPEPSSYYSIKKCSGSSFPGYYLGLSYYHFDGPCTCLGVPPIFIVISNYFKNWKLFMVIIPIFSKNTALVI